MRRLKSLEDAELGRWYLQLRWSEAWECRDMFARRLEFGIFKLHSWPTPGARVVRGDNYKGFWVTIFYWLPWKIGK